MTMGLKNCELCKEREYGKGPVPGCGPQEAKVCLLGRNPGPSEDSLGRPFVGRAGGKLNEGLVVAWLSRAACRVTNVSKCMTPKDIGPTQQCLRICSTTWLKGELCELTQLELVVTLGNQALHYFERLATVGDLHGTVLPVDASKTGKPGVSIFVSYHPSAALRSTIMNKHFMNDMAKLRQYLIKTKLIVAQ